MGELLILCMILLPFLVLCSAVGGAVELYGRWRGRREDKPDIHGFPAPRFKEKVFGDELDDFICREDESA